MIPFRCCRALGHQAAKKQEKLFFLPPGPAASPRVLEEGWEPIGARDQPTSATGRPAALSELTLTSG